MAERSEILGPAFLCATLLIIAFIPIVTLQRVEGRIFRPLGITLIAALVGGQIGTLVFIPIAANFAPLGKVARTRVDEFFETFLGKLETVGRKLATQKMLRILAGIILAGLIFLASYGLGREFLPQLNEGALYIRATAPATISREAAVDLARTIRERLKEIPEVTDVVSQIGRPDDGTDINGFDNIEIFVSMVRPDKWKSAQNIDGFNRIAQEKLTDIHGVEFNYSQPIKDNVDEAISGVKGELVVKLFGSNLTELQKLGDQVGAVLRSVPGAEDVGVERLLGQPELRFKMDRDLLAGYGLSVVEAEEVLETGLAGKVAAKLVDEQGRWVDIVAKPHLPANPSAEILSTLPIITAEGVKIPLGEVAAGSLVEGVSRIYRESGRRRIAIKCSVRNRAVVNFVSEASKKIDQSIHLPAKYQIVWAGSFENAERAGRQLLLTVPLCLLAMIVLLYTWLKSWSLVASLLWELPFAALGGLTARRLFHLNLSISAAAGATVLIGVTLLTGMMLISEFVRQGDVWKALHEKGRSILISNAVAIIGLAPAAFSRGIGSETARPFAVMIMGGLVTSLTLSLLLLPALLLVSGKQSDY